jgi:magnesium transporter
MGRTRCYRDGKLVAEGFPVEQVSDLLTDPANTVWFDICRPDPKNLATLQDELGLHTLAVEDVLQPGQRPKVDHYPEHKLIVAYALTVDPDTNELRGHEVGLFVIAHAVVTVREDESFDIAEVMRRWDNTPDLARSGVAFLLYGILDYAVDTHFAALQQLDNELDALEDMVFEERSPDTAQQRRTYELRKSLVNVRRIVLPMREVVNTIMRRDLELLDAPIQPYFQDVYDHVVRVTEWADSLRDLLSNILDARLALRSNRLNSVMKKVTSWAAIIAVPTAVTGFYGQNLPYPGFEAAWGFWVSTVVILVASGSLYIAFKVRDWL